MTFKLWGVCFILIYSLTFIHGAKLKHITGAMSLQRLTALRALMASHPTSLAAYIVPTADAHNSEYISPADARREWLSGFTGSAGTAVVTASKALVWTDGRYYTQFEKEADLKIWTLMKQSLPDTLSMEKWLTSNLTAGSVVGVDPHTMTREEWTPLQTALSKAKMQLIAVDKNLVDQARLQLNDPPPERPQNDIIYLPLQYTGKSAGQKIMDLREKMAEKKASALVITALDEIAYTLNLRGSDITFNPVFFSYLLITPNSVTLFWQEGCIPENIIKYVSEEGVKIEGKPYAQITDVLRNLAQDLSNTGDGEHSIWLSNEASEAVHRAISGEGVLKKPLTLISEVSPVALAKLIKNDVELEGFRRCHIRDGTAVVRFFKWLHDQIDAGNTVTEIEAAERLLEFRKDEKDFMGPSFETIAGAGENGAIIHYSPSVSSPRAIRADDVFLLDSGGQYRDGTTDITRTRHMGDPTDHQKDAFTRVLKGQIGIGAALYPLGVKGNVLDTLARKYLWDVGLDYAHGTGHGVGHFLNVHEGPSGISWRPYPHDPGLKSGQILSNEPGYYKVGEFGIRHEDLIETTLINKNSKHPRASNLRGDYDGRGVLGFNTLTLVPNQRKFMKIELLDEFELNYTNSYHERVLSTLGPILKERGLNEDFEWLKKECAPIKCLGQHIVFGYVPASYYDYPESHTYDKSTVRKLSRAISLDRVTAVKNVMSQNGIDAFVIPTADAHNSEYIAPTDARREWVSGLAGSSGTALVTANHSLVWTDGRYFTQFEIEVDTSVWSLMRQGTDPSIQNWLASEMRSGSVVGIDPTTYTRTAWRSLENALQNANIKLQPVYNNFVDEARRNVNDPPPPRPNESLLALSVNFTGQVSRNKISELVNQIRSRKASALILTALDDIAYTLNIRGSDIPYNPVFFSYLIIKADSVNSSVILFWGNGNLSSDITAHLQSEGTQVECRPYTEIFDYLRNMVNELPSDSTVWLSIDGSQAIHLAAEVNSVVTTVSTISPVAMMKYIKNSVELGGFRSAHIKDGIAVVRFLRWVHEQVDAGVNVTEINVVDKLDQLRGEEEYYKGPSFATIAGAGANGAIIHYKPSPEGHQTVVRQNDMLLVDSGGQYMDGTTDITRTVHMGTPTDMQRLTFTRVLKGQILLATAVFPKGTFGRDLETLARKSLWDVGLNYAHGTGHGVGHYLNVHEGPVGIGNLANDPGLVPGIIMSNEPGYYEVGEYGIRHEDLVEVIDLTKESDHIYAADLVGNFTGRRATAFYTISLAPYQTSCLDVNIMNDDEAADLVGNFTGRRATAFYTISLAPYQTSCLDVNIMNDDEAADLVGNFTGRRATAFYTISLAPYQTSCLDVNIMNDDEIKYLNNYNARVLATLGPILLQRNLTADYEWLEKECAPIQRSSAILLKSSPFFIISIFSLWFGL